MVAACGWSRPRGAKEVSNLGALKLLNTTFPSEEGTGDDRSWDRVLSRFRVSSSWWRMAWRRARKAEGASRRGMSWKSNGVRVGIVTRLRFACRSRYRSAVIFFSLSASQKTSSSLLSSPSSFRFLLDSSFLLFLLPLLFRHLSLFLSSMSAFSFFLSVTCLSFFLSSSFLSS